MKALQGADYLPEGEYAIVELLGHSTLVGRICEVERFGTKMLAIEPIFRDMLLPAVFQGGGSIYRLTPCTAKVAWDKQPRNRYELPGTIFATIEEGETTIAIGRPELLIDKEPDDGPEVFEDGPF